ncbi:MAG TPA: universal stress protein, partial [Microlunatus sp.]|nr:universal stress protein [Microlunatus sp.]HVK36237.1 universal stress protein [Microlunatus sp.]
MSKHLIVGIDGSPESEAAMSWALEEATRRDLEVELVYALAVPVVSDAYGMVMTRPDIDELTDYSQKLLD